MLHRILERIDYPALASGEANALASTAALLPEELARGGLEAQWAEPLLEGLLQLVHSPLGGALGPCQLGTLEPGSWLNELSFDLPLAVPPQRLVRSGLPAGQVQLLRLTAGSEEVGYLYNFVHGGQVLAYQSGFHFGLTERHHHPGLVTHAQAVPQALVAGLDGSDFLAGEARYKQQLANQTYPMTTFTLQRPSLGWRLEQLWRGCQDWRQRLRSHVRMPG